MRALVIGGARFICSNLVRRLVRRSLADISKARQAFGYAPSVAPAEGLSEYMAWAKAAGV